MYLAPQEAFRKPERSTASLRSYTTYDLYGRYNITTNFGVIASIINLTDEQPVFDPSFSTTYFFDRQAGYDIRGRIFRIGVDYKFK